jgi:antitoxin (DNA-binding transcriptional repressor) of toxin-antitoxin stability system
MNTVSIRQLNKHTSLLMQRIEDSGEPALITRGDEPVGFVVPLEYAREHLPGLMDVAAGPESRPMHR